MHPTRKARNLVIFYTVGADPVKTRNYVNEERPLCPTFVCEVGLGEMGDGTTKW